jgi:DNA (cytosine-5)-methyltransferase 1
MPDGIPAGLDGPQWRGWAARLGEPQHEWEPPRIALGVPDRVNRLRAIGNAVVPQVAEWVGEYILSGGRERRRLD